MVVLNFVPLVIVRDAGVPDGLFTVTSMLANEDVLDRGTYPRDLA